MNCDHNLPEGFVCVSPAPQGALHPHLQTPGAFVEALCPPSPPVSCDQGLAHHTRKVYADLSLGHVGAVMGDLAKGPAGLSDNPAQVEGGGNPQVWAEEWGPKDTGSPL